MKKVDFFRERAESWRFGDGSAVDLVDRSGFGVEAKCLQKLAFRTVVDIPYLWESLRRLYWRMPRRVNNASKTKAAA